MIEAPSGPVARSPGVATVAVVIPVGGPDTALGAQVRRVLDQSCPGLVEVVLSLNTADLGHQAEVSDLVAEIADRRVRLVDSSGRRGAAHARNVGMRSTTASRVAFCDSDDLVHDGWLAPLVGALDEYDAVSGHVIDVFPDGRGASWHPPATPNALPLFLGRPYLLTGTLAVRRAAFEEVGGFDESLTRCEDIALSWLLQDHGLRIGYIPESVIDYRHRPGMRAMLKQHYLYGVGMSEVLRKYGTPHLRGSYPSRAPWRLLRPNGQSAGRRTFGGVLRRAALGVGRLRGLLLPARRAVT